MIVSVKVIPNASCDKIIPMPDGSLKIKTQSVAENGKANKSVIQLLANYYKVSRKNVKIVSGETSHQKIIEIIDLQNPNPCNM